MKNILLPTDFSENANHAIKYAVAFAKESGATIHLLNIFGLEYNSHPDMPDISYDMANDEAKDGLNKVEKLIHDYDQDANINVQKHVLIGHDIDKVIREAIDNYSIDFITMSTKGASGLKEIIFGSTTVKVINHSNVPAIIIPEQVGDNFNFKNVVLATDFTPLSTESIELLGSICNLFDSELKLVHVNTFGKDDFSDEKEAFSNSLGDIKHSYEEVEHADITIAINEYALDNDVWLVAMGEKKKNWFDRMLNGSNLDNMALFSNFPILTLPVA